MLLAAIKLATSCYATASTTNTHAACPVIMTSNSTVILWLGLVELLFLRAPLEPVHFACVPVFYSFFVILFQVVWEPNTFHMSLIVVRTYFHFLFCGQNFSAGQKDCLSPQSSPQSSPMHNYYFHVPSLACFCYNFHLLATAS